PLPVVEHAADGAGRGRVLVAASLPNPAGGGDPFNPPILEQGRAGTSSTPTTSRCVADLVAVTHMLKWTTEANRRRATSMVVDTSMAK
ncbi:unnamed protein product, partial [Urochloa humidicola]